MDQKLWDLRWIARIALDNSCHILAVFIWDVEIQLARDYVLTSEGGHEGADESHWISVANSLYLICFTNAALVISISATAALST